MYYYCVGLFGVYGFVDVVDVVGYPWVLASLNRDTKLSTLYPATLYMQGSQDVVGSRVVSTV